MQKEDRKKNISLKEQPYYNVSYYNIAKKLIADGFLNRDYWDSIPYLNPSKPLEHKRPSEEEIKE